MPKEKKIEPLVQALFSYFDWEENSEQAREVNASILAAKTTARQQGYEAGRAEERERVANYLMKYDDATLADYYADTALNAPEGEEKLNHNLAGDVLSHIMKN